MARPPVTGTASIYDWATWVVIGRRNLHSMQTNHIIKMSIKLIEHARTEIGHDLVFRAVRIELSPVDNSI
jgi:hypothetical protein